MEAEKREAEEEGKIITNSPDDMCLVRCAVCHKDRREIRYDVVVYRVTTGYILDLALLCACVETVEGSCTKKNGNSASLSSI